MSDELEIPSFKYVPDPVEAGAVQWCVDPCVVCGCANGWGVFSFVYKGLEDPLVGCGDVVVCPWCVADGAAYRYGYRFFLEADVGGGPQRWPPVSGEVLRTLVGFTPCFGVDRDQRWITCCNDACAFLGWLQKEKLESLGEEAKKAYVRSDPPTSLDEVSLDWESLFDEDGGDGLMMFRCLHCGKLECYEQYL